MDAFLSLGIVCLLIGLNAFFVASEFALVSVRRSRIDELVSKGKKRARLLQYALNNLNNYISAIQLGVTIASLAIGWIGEPTIATLIHPFFTFLPDPFFFVTLHTFSAIIAFGIITFIHVIIGELIPKMLALTKTEGIALLTIAPLTIFVTVFKPIIWLLTSTSYVIAKIFKIKPDGKKKSRYSEDEVKIILNESSQTSGGTIPHKEVEMVHKVFQLGDTTVDKIMIPQKEIIAFDKTTPLSQIVKEIIKHPYSRFPVFEKTINSIIGFVHVKDIYKSLLQYGENITLAEVKILRKVIIIKHDQKVDALLQLMRKKRIHLAIVIDTKGKTVGLLSLEDVIESLVGEIEDEFDIPS